MDCGTTLVKYILFIFNTLVSILGILAIIYGVILEKSIGAINIENQNEFPTEALFSVCLIAIGSIVVLISFLGCCGAIREDVCMTMCYAVFILILLILQMVLVVLLWINKDNIAIALANLIDNAWQAELKHPGTFEPIQQSLECCGATGSADYFISLRSPTRTCCPAGYTCTPLNYYGGCRDKIRDLISGSSDHAKYFGIGLIGVEIIGFVFACCLANNVRNYKRRNAY